MKEEQKKEEGGRRKRDECKRASFSVWLESFRVRGTTYNGGRNETGLATVTLLLRQAHKNGDSVQRTRLEPRMLRRQLRLAGRGHQLHKTKKKSR